jgi:hypothetical protein
MPGFGLTFGYSVLYLSLIVLVPLSALFLKVTSISWAQFWETVTAPRAIAAYRLTFTASLIGAAINAVFGLSSPGRSCGTGSPASASWMPPSICRSPCRPPFRASR